MASLLLHLSSARSPAAQRPRTVTQPMLVSRFAVRSPMIVPVACTPSTCCLYYFYLLPVLLLPVACTISTCCLYFFYLLPVLYLPVACTTSTCCLYYLVLSKL
jgi:hypothetical protein